MADGPVRPQYEQIRDAVRAREERKQRKVVLPLVIDVLFAAGFFAVTSFGLMLAGFNSQKISATLSFLTAGLATLARKAIARRNPTWLNEDADESGPDLPNEEL